MSNAPKPTPPKSAVTTGDVAALSGVSTTLKAGEKVTPANARIVVSQGAFEDLARLRKITDAGSGYTLRVGHDGTVTAYDRATGEPADVDVICPTVPAAPAQDETA